MNNLPRVAVIGASGAVGEQVISLLANKVQLRVGSRRLPDVRHPGVEYLPVDVFDCSDLRHFCLESALIINCAAPGSIIADRVARVAFDVGSDYLDPGGDDHLYFCLKDKADAAQRCVLSAGMLPGLSGLMLRIARQHFKMMDNATGYSFNGEPFSYGGAVDFIASLDSDYGVPGVMLYQGKLRPCKPLSAIQLPMMRHEVAAIPFMTSEWLRLSHSEKIHNLSWYNLFASDELRQWLTKKENHHVDAANDLVALSINAFAGQSAQHVLAVEAQGNSDGHEHHCAWLITCSSGSSLTAAVTAYAAQQILLNTIPKGLHFAADVLSPEGTIEFIQQNLVTGCWIELPSLFSNEEGAI